MFEQSRITFRPLDSDDLKLMYQWLRAPEVGRWYGRTPTTFAEVEAKYLSRISGRDPVNCYIVEYQQHPVAYIQTYRIDHDPEYAAALNVDQDAAGIDLFIGEERYRYRGFGSVLLREFLQKVLFTNPETSCCIIAPVVSNTSAIRAYEKAGFTHIKTVNVPHESEPEYVMILWPEQFD